MRSGVVFRCVMCSGVWCIQVCDAFRCRVQVCDAFRCRVQVCDVFRCVMHSGVWCVQVCDAFRCRVQVCDAFRCRVQVCDAFRCRVQVCDRPAQMFVVNEENIPRGQSPADELTADVYSSSSDNKNRKLNLCRLVVITFFILWHFYHFVALSLGLAVVVLVNVAHVCRDGDRILRTETNNTISCLIVNSQLRTSGILCVSSSRPPEETPHWSNTMDKWDRWRCNDWNDVVMMTHRPRSASCTTTSWPWRCRSVWIGSWRCHGTNPQCRSSTPWTHNTRPCGWSLTWLCGCGLTRQCGWSLTWLCGCGLTRQCGWSLTWSCGSYHTPSRAPSCCSGCRTCTCTCDSRDTDVYCWPGTWTVEDNEYTWSPTVDSENPTTLASCPPSQFESSSRCKTSKPSITGSIV